MTLPRYLVLGQARTLGAVCLLVWGVLLVGAVAGQLFGGVDFAFVLDPGTALPLCASLLPEAIQIALPLALAVHVLLLRDGGELSAAAASGVPGWRVQAAILLPALPLLVILSWAVHDGRPAALAEFRAAVHRGALRAAVVWQRALQARDVGAQPAADGGWHALVPVGDGCLALALDRRPDFAGEGRGLGRLGPGRFYLLAAGDAPVRSGAFVDVEVELPSWRLPLQQRSVRELDSAMLARGAPRWLAAQPDAGRREAAERAVSRALRGRRLVLWAALLGALWACWPLWTGVRLPIFLLHGLATVPGVALALVLPRAAEAYG